MKIIDCTRIIITLRILLYFIVPLVSLTKSVATAKKKKNNSYKLLLQKFKKKKFCVNSYAFFMNV